ncbi:NADPH-dependent F420 reductase [Archangium lansingense]|uniref:NAD(P)-binding domain-containing protein n=1 Tax=Archangium lansingense TaxID=2995310 RepID=A0ABT3ZYD2_9BACT|nr:NAD(P)-binding domain-containing protein [Archangium lansinium]MCY1074416.1 NAD(P)-binding domain-containing protein [Archangium lansinium]
MTQTQSVAVIGTGNMGRGLARILAAAGHDVFLGSREPVRARQLATELGAGRVQGMGNVEAASRASLLFLAYHSNDTLLEELAPVTEGKVVVDISTYHEEPPSDFNPLTQVPSFESPQERTARRLPRAHVLGAFQVTWAQLFDAPLLDGCKTPVFVLGDHVGAKAELLALIRTLPFEPVDAGGLRQARTVAAMYFLVTRLAHQYGFREHGHDWRTSVRALNTLLPPALGLAP